MTMKHTANKCLATGAALLLALTLASCADDTSDALDEIAGADQLSLDELSSKLADFADAPPFAHPGPAIDVASLEGKTVYVIPLAYNTEFNKLQADATVEAGEAAGLKVDVYSTSGTPSQWQQGMERAIRDEAAAIILQGPDPRVLAPQIREAIEAGIPVVASHSTDIIIDEKIEDMFDERMFAIAVPGPFTDATRLMADYVTVESDGKAETMYVPLDDFGELVKFMVTAWEGELKAQCPDCKNTTVSTTFADLANSTNGAVQAAMRRNPDISWIAAGFDIQVPHIISALKSMDRTDVKVVSYNGTSGALALIEPDGPFVMDVGEPITVMGWTSIDQAMRLALGEEQVEEPVYMRVFTADNVAETGTPPTTVDGYGDPASFEDGFKNLWGVE